MNVCHILERTKTVVASSFFFSKFEKRVAASFVFSIVEKKGVGIRFGKFMNECHISNTQ